ncbi:MAG: caspase family protein, partial [Bacteroidia bacterium]|nr:caspase family protein [Bacteroidia bacterium]
MKKIIFLTGLSVIIQTGNLYSQSGESQLKQVSIVGKKSIPPVLNITTNFFDSNGNQALDAGEKAKIIINIKNTGKSDATGLTLDIKDNNKIPGLNIEPFNKDLGKLSPESEKNVEVFINGSNNLYHGKADFVITLSEADGFNSAPASLPITTRELAAPLMTISDYRYSTELGGKITLGKTVDLNVVIQNNGEGKAENVVVKFTNPANVFPASNSEYTFMTVEPGDKKLVTYTFLPSEKFQGTEIKISVDIKEKTGRYGASSSPNVTLEEELVSSAKLVTENQGDAIYRGGGDPLKGLNVSEAKKEMQLGDYYALIIGVDTYKGAWEKLDNAVKDAKSIETLLKSKYKFDFFRTLINEQATRKQILKEFEWLVANVKETDNVFIYFSGHGEYKKELDKGFWVPVDATTTSVSDFISNNDIQTFLGGIKSKHTLLVSDACFSGDIFRGNTIAVPFENSEKYYVKVHNLSSRKAISSGGIEPVMDGGREGHSVFAYYLLKALENNNSKFY